MSGIAATGLAALGLGGAPTVDRATEPAAIRHGGKPAQQAYQTGLGFEQMLMSELTQSLTATIGGSDPSSGDPSSDGSAGGDSSGGEGSGSSPLGGYSSLLSGALSSATSSGSAGNAVAMQIAESIDPRLERTGGVT